MYPALEPLYVTELQTFSTDSIKRSFHLLANVNPRNAKNSPKICALDGIPNSLFVLPKNYRISTFALDSDQPVEQGTKRNLKSG